MQNLIKQPKRVKMLDLFIKKGYIVLTEEGNVERTEKCPDNIKFEEDEYGNIKFFITYENFRSPIKDFEII